MRGLMEFDVSHKKGFDKKGLTFHFLDHWQAGRPDQTYYYQDVLREVDRRADGEYLLTPEACDNARQDAYRQIEVQFKLSALLADFMLVEGLTVEQLAAMTFANIDELDSLLDPIPRGGSERLANNAIIDLVYPGKARQVQR